MHSNLCFCDNITDKAADEIVHAITCNCHLQELDINIKKICCSRCYKETMCIDYKNMITDKALEGITTKNM